jgi:peroxiredoxin
MLKLPRQEGKLVKRYLLIGAVLIPLLACCPCGSLLSLIGDVAEAPTPIDSDEEAAPDFTLESLDGSWVSLSDFEGQIVVLDFWTTWCTPCIESLPHLQDIHDRYAGQNVVVLAINVGESRSEIERRIGDGYTFTILLDSDEKVSDSFDVLFIPHTVVIDQDGAVQEVPLGPEGVESAIQDLLP